MVSALQRQIKGVRTPWLVVRIDLDVAQFLVLDARSIVIRDEGVGLVEGVLRPID